MKLAEIKKLCEQATPGPWYYREGFPGGTAQANVIAGQQSVADLVQFDSDAAFIAISRTLMPKFVAIAEFLKFCVESNSIEVIAIPDARALLKALEVE